MLPAAPGPTTQQSILLLPPFPDCTKSAGETQLHNLCLSADAAAAAIIPAVAAMCICASSVNCAPLLSSQTAMHLLFRCYPRSTSATQPAAGLSHSSPAMEQNSKACTLWPFLHWHQQHKRKLSCMPLCKRGCGYCISWLPYLLTSA